MNHRPRTTTLSSLALCLTASSLLTLATAPSALAQAAAAGTPAVITAAIKNDPAAANFKAQIDQYVQQQVARLSDTKAPAAMKRAREALEAAAAGQTSAAYLQVYAASVDANIGKLATSKDLTTRLNAAIVVARVAARAQNAALVPSATKFMNDPQDAVALWGVKAAKPLVPVLLGLNGAVPDTLTPALLNVVKKHWYSGPIAWEAYDALRLNVAPPTGALAPAGGAPPATPQMIGAVVQPMLTLMGFRAELYGKGIPPQPMAENLPIQFLTQSKVWPVLTDVQRLALVQHIVTITGCAGQHANATDASNDVRGALARMIQTAGSGLQVIGDSPATKDGPTSEAGKALRQISEATPGDVIANTTAAAFTTLSASQAKWSKGLKPAPTIAEPGKILSPNEPLDDGGDAAPATAGGGGAAAPAAAGAGAGAGTTGGAQ